MDLSSLKTQIIVEANKFRLGPRLLRLQTQTEGSATKITKIKNVNGAIVPSLGAAPVSLLELDSVIVFPLTIKLPILFAIEDFEDNALNDILQRSFKESFHFADIENRLVVETLIAGAGKTITAQAKPDVREVPIIDNFLEAIRFIEDNGYAPNKILVNPDIAESLRQREELKEKLIAYAIEVIINIAVPSQTVIILDSNHAGLLIERVSLEINDYIDPWQGKKGFLLRERVAPVVINGNAVAVIQ
ncbi:hypothetical protein DRJ17_00770 [Candidatus Woesearchaeota archaeon]|nr:MAG: hypothetical protein DRJ17_00770 [Candidatus Woesearchaeota archaeon]